MKSPGFSTFQVMLRVALVIAVGELFIKLVILVSQHLYTDELEVVIEVAFLLSVLPPVIYFWIISPFIQERNIANLELAEMSYTDKLTGLSNPRVFIKCMEKALAECARHHIHAALILIDLDDFKAINESHGREFGDAALVEISRRLLKGIRKEDVVSRVGDDEFLILIKQLNDNREKSADEALAFAEKIKDSIFLPIEFKEKSFQVSSSLGVNLLSSDTYNIEAEIRKADVAMNHAKRVGKGHVVMYDSAMVSRNRDRS